MFSEEFVTGVSNTLFSSRFEKLKKVLNKKVLQRIIGLTIMTICMYFVAGRHFLNPTPDMHSVTLMVFAIDHIVLGFVPLFLCVYAGMLMQRGMKE